MVTMAMVSVAMVRMAFSREARPKVFLKDCVVVLRVGDGGWHRDGGPDESRLWCEKDFGLRQNANWEEAMLGPIPSYFSLSLGHSVALPLDRGEFCSLDINGILANANCSVKSSFPSQTQLTLPLFSEKRETHFHRARTQKPTSTFEN